MDEFQKKELKIIEIKDILFNRFCSLINKIRLDIRKNTGWWRKFKDAVKDIFNDIMPAAKETNTLSAIEERWAIFLRKIEDGQIKIEEAEKEYQTFSIQI